MKEVIHQDTIYSEETVQRITDLRHERWAILAVMSPHKARQAGSIFGANEITRLEARLQEVKAELFHLTQTPQYTE